MKTRITLFVFLLFGTLAQAQDVINPSIHWTKSQHMARKQDLLNYGVFLKGDDKSFVFLYQTMGQNPFGGTPHSYFVHMDLESDVPSYLRVQLKEEDGSQKRNWLQVHTINDSVYIFSTRQDKKEKKHIIYVETLNTDLLSYNNDVRQIGEISYGDIEGKWLSNFVVTLSPDEERVLLSYSITHNDEVTSFCLQVMDRELNTLWQRTDEFPRIEGSDVLLSNYTIDNDGNVYIAQNRFDKKIKKWDLFLTCFPYDSEEPRILNMDFESDKHSMSEAIICSPEGDIICAGLFSKPGKSSALGAYSFRCAPQLANIEIINVMDFADEFITMGMQDKDIEKMMKQKEKGKEFDEGFSYRMHSRFHRKDGGFSLILEKYKLQIQTVSNGFVTYNVFYHNFNDIMVLTYNEDGTVRWVQKVPKSQRLVNIERLYGSYSAFVDEDDNIDIVYNENVRDKMSDKAQPLWLRIDSEGEMSFKELFKNDKEVRKSFAPQLTYRLAADKYLLARVDISKMKGVKMQWGVANMNQYK